MTIQEMHIAVNLGVQKIASFQVDNLLPQEIDHELNVAMEKFIKQRYNPMGNKYREGFEQSQKRIDDLRNLVVTNNANLFYIGEAIESNSFFIERTRLPLDYLFLIGVRARIQYDCNTPLDVKTISITKGYLPISLTPPVSGYKLRGIQYYDPANPTSFGGYIIDSENGLEYDDYNNVFNYSLGIVPADSIDSVSTSSPTEYSPTVDSNTLLLSTTNIAYLQNGARAVWVNPQNTEEVINVDYTSQNFVSIATTTRYAENEEEKLVPCKYVQQDDIYALLYDPFNTTKHKYPKYTIQENFIDIYSDNKFIPIFVMLTYIRHPKKLDLINGIGCELPEHTHQEIVEMAVKSILETIESPRYQTQTMENIASE